jgi:hypothetical protein
MGRALLNRGLTPKLESRLVGGSIVESKIPRLPSHATVTRANWISDFSHAEKIAHIRVRRLLPSSLADY